MPNCHQRRSGAIFSACLDPSFEKLSYSPKHPPTNYTFVPKGDVYVTRHCRDLTRKAGQTLYLVFNSNTHKRIGLHCPIQIYETVKEDAAASAEKRRKAVAKKDQRDISHARDLLFQQFPRIPKESAKEILEHGFLKGSGRVGRSTTLDEELKIELAVNAHIRHRFTEYDSLYSQMKVADVKGDMKKIARERVFDQVTNIAQSWRRIAVARPSISLDVMDEMIQANQNEAAAQRGWNVDIEPDPKSQRPPQRRAAMVASISLKEQSSFGQKEVEPWTSEATSRDFPIRPEKSIHASHKDTIEAAPDLKSIEEEQMHGSSLNDEILRRKARSKAAKAEMYEEWAKQDLELLKLDPSHEKRMNRSRSKRVAKLQNKMARETALGPSVGRLKGPEKNIQLVATDSRRAAKIARRKLTREKNAVDDLRQYELNPNIRLPRKRMNRVHEVQRQMRMALGEKDYKKIEGKRKQGVKTTGQGQTDLPSRLIEPSSKHFIAPLGKSTAEDLERELDRMDIS